MKTFKIHMTNEFGTGLSTKKAHNLKELIFSKLNKKESKNWFSIWEEESGEEFLRTDDWMDELELKTL